MPNYDYGCRGCDAEFTKFARVANRDKPCKTPCEDCGGEIYQKIGAPPPVTGVNHQAKIPDGFKDVLKNIKNKSGKGCTVDV